MGKRLAALACVVLLPAIAGTGAPTLEECDARVVRAPSDSGSYHCFTLSVRAHGRADDAVRRLEAILAIDPGRHHAKLNLAFIEERRNDPRAERLYREAAEGAAAVGDHAGEVYARLSLGYGLSRRARLDEADAEIERALSVAQVSGDATLLARVRQNQGFLALAREDYTAARRHYRMAEAHAFPDGDPQLQGFIVSGLGTVCWYLGELDAAMDYFEREAEIWHHLGDRHAEASALFNVALLSGRLQDQGRISGEERRTLEREALDAAIEAGNASAEAAIRLSIGQDLAGRAALEEFERALALSRQAGALNERLLAMRLIANETFELGPAHREAAERLLAAALEEARSLERHHDIARALVLRATFAWRSGPREAALAAYLEAFDAVERLRELQGENRVRARVFSQWVYPYYRLSGGLLASLDASADPGTDLDLAFRTIERMRARVLLDCLDAAGVEAEVPAEIPGVAEIRRALGADQALLGFQLPFDRFLDDDAAELEGGAWVTVLTRDDARAFHITRRHELGEQAEIFLGLFGRRDGSEIAPATRIYRGLLADALEGLPDSISRLVIVPDAALHRLPFGALRETVRARPLAARFEITYAPSARLWLQWRASSTGGGARALAIVDPALDVAGDASELREAAGPLPHARREADAVMKIAGRGTLRVGPEASERYLKQTDLGPYGIVHFATHAVVDERRPDGSAVVLAAGAAAEDGLLRVPEIVELDLDGKLVILAACRSARGELIEGEGVLGLARALFQAGARVVVASLWPVRDDETAALMDEFARELGRGASVAGALARARRARIAAGAPAEAWAGLIVLGDGDVVPLPGGGGRPWWPLAAAVLLGLVVALTIWLRRRLASAG